MTTQVIFKIDKALKDLAMKKAKKEGIAFSAILKMATKAYVIGDLEIKLTPRDELKNSAKKQLEKSLQDIKSKKNLSEAYATAEEAIKHLKSL